MNLRIIKIVDRNMARCNVGLDKLEDVVVFVVFMIGLVCGISVAMEEGGDCGIKPPTVSIAYLKSEVRDEALRSIFGGPVIVEGGEARGGVEGDCREFDGDDDNVVSTTSV